MARALVLLAWLWPAILASAWWGRTVDEAPARAWSAVVHLAASRLCHQRPERSFQSGGIPWPVCARCSGLYLAVPVGAALGLAGYRRGGARWRLAVAALPTAATIGLEWAGAPMTNLVRAAAALPLGAAVAAVIVDAAGGARRGIK